MKLKDLSDKINNLEQKNLNFVDTLKLNYQFYEKNYNFINQNNFFIKNCFSKINIDIIKYFLQIISTLENKTTNFLEEINLLINKQFSLLVIKNF